MIKRRLWLGAGLLAAAVAALSLLVLAVGPSIGIQPYWPFAYRPSLVTLREAPELRSEAIGGVLLLAVSVTLLAAALALRRLRWAALGTGVILAVLAAPHLDLFFVPAYPTSFYRSPTGFGVASIVAGAALYPTSCVGCHGKSGRGDGPLASSLPVPPANLTAPHLWAHADGELYWWLSRGKKAPDGRLAMPGFADRLNPNLRWALIDYIRAHNGGAERLAAGSWTIPVKAPDFRLDCAGMGPTHLQGLHGHVVRLVFAPVGETRPAAIPAGTPAAPLTVVVGAGAGDCHAAAEDVRAAYGIVAGVSAEALDGAQLLIDPAGWLRDMVLPGQAQHDAPARWQDPSVLLAEIQEICNHPIVEKEISHGADE